MKMGYFTTIVNNYQQLFNLFPDLNMILAMKKTSPRPIWATAWGACAYPNSPTVSIPQQEKIAKLV